MQFMILLFKYLNEIHSILFYRWHRNTLTKVMDTFEKCNGVRSYVE